MQAEFLKKLDDSYEQSKDYNPEELDWLKWDWKEIENDTENEIPDTSVSKERLHEIVTATAQYPENFNINSKVKKNLEARKKAFEEWKAIDWSTWEALAFWTLLKENYKVRITGQDSGRGTFSHRHSVLHDSETGERHIPLNHINGEQGQYEVHDSLLSELWVLGFEYGYSLSSPNALTIWEWQFWDFANGAQMIFDQFIASSETKWFRKSNLTMLLPHGYEGQWPEHSSARLERYLQACAENNLRVVSCTTPANFFHCLRRQLHSKDRKPLAIMSPKSLLRHKWVVSSVEDFTTWGFKPILWEVEKLKKVKKVILCSGKVYYDLLDARQKKWVDDTALLRVEQFYPFDTALLQKELGKYKGYKEIIWCQEESKNMWAWNFVRDYISEGSGKNVQYIWRPASASPATWYAKLHAAEQNKIIEECFPEFQEQEKSQAA
jgi:2-oxoglutarate dehydrogenase E1 component